MAKPFHSIGTQPKRKPHRSPRKRCGDVSYRMNLAAASELLFDGFLRGVPDVLRGIANFLRRLGNGACFGLFVAKELEAEEGRDSKRHDDDQRHAASTFRFAVDH